MLPTPDVRRRVDLQRRRAAISDRLNQRELQAAKQGISTPPEVVLEVEDLRADLRRIDEALHELNKAFFVEPDLTPDGLFDLFVNLRDDMHRAIGPLYNELINLRDVIGAQHAARTAAHEEDRIWRRRVLIWLAILTALLAVVALRTIFTVTLGT